ncbi:SDR family oxidoreductase [Nocardiopsis quinghaiensis]|uniref:SDR family oxidoreductase n=1 Tax=Nocardiopsis quinghaiensis TaxID=464995 RepID=UPI00123BB279|nr:SDR family oxidoreductase [Nocardiopsis quinghaiensis]
MSPRPDGHRPDTLVLGANGFIGRWLTAELLGSGRSVAVGTRSASSARELLDWLHGHAVPTDRLLPVHADITLPGLGLDDATAQALADVRDVYNCAALFRFGLTRGEAGAANVDGALNALRWAAGRERLRRAVHISGYRVAGVPGSATGTGGEDIGRAYREHGPYEASKREGHEAVRALAEREGIALSIVSPGSVIGDSTTGEAGQYIGLAESVEDLWRGRLPALPGSAATFVPVVTVDHLARFLAAVPEHDTGGPSAHWVLDDRTPHLHALLRGLADHLGVRAPRVAVPLWLLRRLPRALTGVEPETLSFLSEDRYDTASADTLARAAGLEHPPVWPALTRWADRLVADRFGA